MMDGKISFLHHVGESPRMKILHFLIANRDLDFSLTNLLQAGVSWGTLNQIVPELAKLNIIMKTRKIGRATLYQINHENIVAQQLIKMYDHLHADEQHDENDNEPHHEEASDQKLFYVG